ncbi:MAG: hypothetical protein AAFP90_16240 [Planctomycetota bacterium]
MNTTSTASNPKLASNRQTPRGKIRDENPQILAIQLAIRGEWEYAIRCFESILEQASLTAEGNLHFAHCLASVGRDQDAAHRFLQAAISRTLPQSEMLNIADNLAKMDAKSMAAMVYQWILDADPGCAEAYLGLSHLGGPHDKTPYFREANLRMAYRLQPSNSDIVDALVELLNQGDRRQEACDLLREFHLSKMNATIPSSCRAHPAASQHSDESTDRQNEPPFVLDTPPATREET